MPFRQHIDLEPATLDVMAAAYDDVCKLLEIRSTDPRTSALASPSPRLHAPESATQRSYGSAG